MVKRRSETYGAAGVADGDALGGDLSEIRRACRADGPLEARSRPGAQGAGRVLCGVVRQEQDTPCPKLSGAVQVLLCYDAALRPQLPINPIHRSTEPTHA